MAEKKQKMLQFKGRPVVRQGRTIYYGDMKEDYVVMMQITSVKKVKDLDVADRVLVQLLRTDPSLPPLEKMVRNSEVHGLFAAMDRACKWLDQAERAD